MRSGSNTKEVYTNRSNLSWKAILGSHGIKASEGGALRAGRRKKMACQPQESFANKEEDKRVVRKVFAVIKIHLLRSFINWNQSSP